MLWAIALWEDFWSSVFLCLSPYLQVSALVASIYLPTPCTHQCTHLSTHLSHPSVCPSICSCTLPTHPICLLTHPPIYLPIYSCFNSPTHPVSFPPSQSRRGFLCTQACEVVPAASEAVSLVITSLMVCEPFLCNDVFLTAFKCVCVCVCVHLCVLQKQKSGVLSCSSSFFWGWVSHWT